MASSHPPKPFKGAVSATTAQFPTDPFNQTNDMIETLLLEAEDAETERFVLARGSMTSSRKSEKDGLGVHCRLVEMTIIGKSQRLV